MMTSSITMFLLLRFVLMSMVLCPSFVIGGGKESSSSSYPGKEEILSINRHFQGDIFVAKGGCSFCTLNGTGEPLQSQGAACECQCKPDYPIYREDQSKCVNDFPECMLADFISGSASEKIPFVFMPLAGQLIYPSAEIAISDVDSQGHPVLAPICVVSSVDILEAQGWRSFENITGDAFQQPFQLHRNDDKTFLQWLGDDKLRKMLEGRLVLVHLLCKDTIPHSGKQLFSPCVAFRVAGTPGSVLLPSSLHEEGRSRQPTDEEDGLSFGDYLAIGVCVAFLGIIYIVAIIFFIFMKRKRRRKERLRRQFLKPPSTLPPGLRHKSSVLLGLEAAFMSEVQNTNHPRDNSSSNHPFETSTTSLGTTRMDEPVYDITKQSKKKDGAIPKDSPEFQESIVLQRNDKLLDAASKQVNKGKSNSHICSENNETDNLERILVNSSRDKEVNEQNPQNSSEFFSKIRFLVKSARARMKVRYSPRLTDIPEEIHTPKTYKNPAFMDEDNNFMLNRKGASSSSTNFQSFNDVNAKLYRSFRDNKKGTKNDQESSDYSSQEDSLGKRSSREMNDPLSLDSGVITNGSVSPTSTTNDHNHGCSSTCSSPQDNPVTHNESNSNCNETDDEVVDVASEDTDSSDNDGYFDSLQRPRDENGIVETISPQFKSSYGGKASSVLSPNSSIRKPNSIVPNYLVSPPSDRSEQKSNQESIDLLTKLYDKAVLKIPKVIPSDNESLYSDRSNTMKSIDRDSLDPKRNGKGSGILRRAIEEDSTYEIIECPEDRPGVYVNDMYSPDTLNDRKKSTLVGEKMILSVSGAPPKSEGVFTNKLLIAVDYNNSTGNAFKKDKGFDPDTLERAERDSLYVKKGSLKKKKIIQGPPDLPPKVNIHSSPKPLPQNTSKSIPPPPPLPPASTPYTKGPKVPSSKILTTPSVSVHITPDDEEDAIANMSFQERREKLENSFKMRRPQCSSVLKRIRETEKGEYCGSMPADGVSKGMEIALNIRSRVANQNSLRNSKNSASTGNNSFRHHVQTQPSKDSFKSSWRKTVEFVGGSHHHHKDEGGGRSIKQRPEDSGYISTDSSDSRNRVIKLTSSISNEFDDTSLNQSEGSMSSLDERSSSYDNFEASLCEMSRPKETQDSVLPLSYKPLQNPDVRTYKL